ncbi:amine oxidase [flavin-containing] A-like [Apis laboriosa]|uniref:amine oxidase [flavin-containing] A-like n=1 Tax=Apis laboriosa TaxID=183418 RepID=UPI001CC5F3FF|nr:amine oxidase [flavin-containing] A-like [Apis laboriosa]
MRNLNDISALWFFVMLYGASGFSNRLRIMLGDNNQYFVQGGMSKITHTLLKRILQEQGEIKYVEPVSKIMFNDAQAYVFTEKEYFRCQLAVIAIPPSMMDSITIEPSTYTKSLYAPAENVFFNVTYKKPFWTDGSIKDIITTWDFANNLNFVHDTSHEHSNKVVLTGFLAESHFTQTRKKCLFATLDDCYKSTNASNYLRYKEYDPSLINDQVTFGCPMSTLKPTSFDDHLHKEESYDRILFTSSEYAKNWPGTVDGAIQAGERTAFEVLLRIRPQVLSFRDMTTLG